MNEVKQARIDDSLLGIGLYSVPEAARILSHALRHPVSEKNLRRWAYGRRRANDRGTPPLIAPTIGLIADSYTFSFSDVVELLTIAVLRNEGVKMRAIYAAYAAARREFGDHPFSRKRYAIDGAGIFVRKPQYDGDMVDLATGRRAFEQILAPLLRDIVIYDEDAPLQIAPLGKDRSVTLDPERSFGAPINRDTSIPTQILYGMHLAGESDDAIAGWYGVPLTGVRDAIEYEAALQQAA